MNEREKKIVRTADLVVVGAGAAGVYGAIQAAEALAGTGGAAAKRFRIVILEKGRKPLQKVKISGGGRCNLTHACYEPRPLSKHYPRGERELISPFHQHGPTETLQWFGRQGLHTHTEADGRIFPTTNQSESVIEALLGPLRKHNIQLQTGSGVQKLVPPEGADVRWQLHTPEAIWHSRAVLFATGSSPQAWQLLQQLGHSVVAPVPSLFTFNIKDERLKNLAGVSVAEAAVSLPKLKLKAEGPLLITHWGLSGPGVLRISAWGAEKLHSCGYSTLVRVNWAYPHTPKSLRSEWETLCRLQAQKQVHKQPQFGLPQRLWERLVAAAKVPEGTHFGKLRASDSEKLMLQLSACDFALEGKSTFKDEFVTAGGVELKEVELKTFKSKLLPNLWLAGETLNIDAITGGFNFQAAWTGGYLAGQSIAAHLLQQPATQAH